MNVERLVPVLVSVTILLALPLAGSAQETDEPSMVRLVWRLGFAEHDKGGSAYLGELALRTRGPIVLGVAAGFINTRVHDVQLVLPEIQFNGQWVRISGGDAHFHSYRFRGLAGYAFDLEGVWIESTLEGGFARESGEEGDWQPWALVGLALRGDAGFGVQGGIGRHRVTTRYHTAGSDVFVGEVHSWGTFSELLFSVPLI